jgi:hypothetical protein
MKQNRIDLEVDQSIDNKSNIPPSNSNYILEKKGTNMSNNDNYYNKIGTLKDQYINIIENQASRFGTYKQSELNEYDNLDSSRSSFLKLKKYDFHTLTSDKLSITERVFWTKEKMDYIRIKFNMAKEKIKRKTEFDFSELYLNIKEGNVKKIL